MTGSKHAYLITAYGDLRNLHPLMRLIDDPRNDVFVQADGKGLVNAVPPTVHAGLTVLKPYPMWWGGFSFVQSYLRLMQAAAPGRYRYYHVLTGADLPLVGQDRIHDALASSELEFVDFASQHDIQAHWKAAYRHLLVENPLYTRYRSVRAADHGLVKLQQAAGLDRSRRNKERFFHGSGYFSITHVLVEYVLEHEKWIRDTFRHGLACDEVFLQTLLMKSPLRSRCAPPDGPYTANLRYINWEKRAKNSPYTFRSSDYDDLKQASTRAFFARKFNPAVDAEVISMVVEAVRNEGKL